MLRNYVTVAWRALTKHKGFSAINLFGLAVGMSLCLLILTLVRDQGRRDEHHPHAERIYRVTSTTPAYGAQRFATSPGPVGPVTKRTVPGVEQAVRVRDGTFDALRANALFSLRGRYAEVSFFDVFDFPLAAGAPRSALENPYSVVLSQAASQKIFGRADPIGQSVELETDALEEAAVFTVTGVLADTEAHSHLSADAYVSFSTLTSPNVAEQPDRWSGGRKGRVFGYYTYLLISEEATPAGIEARLNQIARPHADDRLAAEALALQPLTDIHLGPRLLGDLGGSGVLDRGALYMMSALALLILLAAGFNYANLSVARSLTRAQEIGVRKTVGAGRGQIAAQFLGESVLMALLALVIALGLLRGLVPFFNGLQFVAEGLQIQITLNPLAHPFVLLLFAGFAVGVGLVAGAYPAVYLSRFAPVQVLRRTGNGGATRPSGLRLRRGLAMLQFGMALCFIVSAALLYRQAAYLTDTDFGFDFDTKRLAYVGLQDASPQAFKQQATQLPDVESVSVTSRVPGIGAGRAGTGTLRRAAGRSDSARAYDYWIGPDYVENMGVRLVAGDAQAAAEGGASVLVNEEAARVLGFAAPPQIVGETIAFEERGGREVLLRVAGVVENYTNMNPDAGPDPHLLRLDVERGRYALVRAHPGKVASTEARLQTLWARFDAVHPLDYDTYEAFAGRITALMTEGVKVIGLAALLAVLIACLGLLGMASYSVRRRTQEIGIRKALGASAGDVVWLLSKEYLWLVAGAGALALPLAYVINRQWLTTFAHRIDIGWATPGLSVAALLAAALAVVGTQALRAARTNPAEALRDE